MAKKPIKVTEVVLRDAHQSLLATRMTMDEMRPILPEMDKINYFSVECWGGATFDSCIRFLDEDPWERLRILRKELPHQKLQMLFRGQNMLGYRPYADDAVEYFVQKSVANGIDVIRIFDALNDPRNLQTAIKSANKEGAHVQGCISYTLSPVHNNEYFAAYAKTLEEMGANSICIKDMAGLLTPYTCYDLVKKLKETVSIPVDIHSHYTAGLASMSILKGIEAGADIIDTAMSPLSLGTSHMPTESLVAALQGTDYDTGLDLKQLNVVRAYFAKLREKYIANGQISPKSLGVDANTLLYQVPGGMFSNMVPTGEEFTYNCELAFIAAGFVGCESYVADAFGVSLTGRGCVDTDHFRTNVDKVFACGDMRRGQSLVVWGLREGRDCAAEVDRYLMGYTNL